MTNSSSLDPLASSGVDPKTAEALRKFVRKTIDQEMNQAVEKALRPSGFTAQSRPQDATQNPASKVLIVLTGIIAFAAVVSVQLGAFYWLNDSIPDEFGKVRDEIGSVRAEIGSVRAEVADLRAEVGELRERVIRIEILIEDRLPSTP